MEFLIQEDNKNFAIINNKLIYNNCVLEDVSICNLGIWQDRPSCQVKQYSSCVITIHDNIGDTRVAMYDNKGVKAFEINTEYAMKNGFSRLVEINAQACSSGVLISMHELDKELYKYYTYDKKLMSSNNFSDILKQIEEYEISCGIKQTKNVISNTYSTPCSDFIMDMLK